MVDRKNIRRQRPVLFSVCKQVQAVPAYSVVKKWDPVRKEEEEEEGNGGERALFIYPAAERGSQRRGKESFVDEFCG